MADKVTVEIGIEERAALKALTRLSQGVKDFEAVSRKSIGESDTQIKALNESYRKGSLTLGEYNSAIKKLDLEKLRKSFQDGKITVGQFEKQLASIRGEATATSGKFLSLNKSFRQGEISAEEYTKAVKAISLKELNKEFDAGRISLDKYERELKSINGTLEKSSSIFTKSGAAVAVFAGNLAANAASAALRKIGDSFADGVRSAIEYEKAITEINTILPKNDRLTRAQIRNLEDVATQYGTNAQTQAKSYYQIVSAGVTDATKATELLEASNRLAIGGLAGAAESIDILTSAVNAYGQNNLSATDAADSLFTAVRLGKTTVSELASSLATVLPAARAAGVGLDETNAAVSVLTANGISTSESVTRLNSLLTAIAKNGKKLGDGFDITAVQTDGLETVLQRLQKRTGGSSDKLIDLLGRVEAVSAAQILGRNNASSYGDAIEEMANKTGASKGAFDEFGKTAEFQLKQLDSNLDRISRNFAESVLPVINAVAGALNDAFEENRKVEVELTPLERQLELVEKIKKVRDEFQDQQDDFFGASPEMLAQQNAELAKQEIILKNLQATNLEALRTAQEKYEQEQAILAEKAKGKEDADGAGGGLTAEDQAILNSKLALREQLALLEEENKIVEEEKQLIKAGVNIEKREAAIKALQDFEANKIEIIRLAELEKNKQIEDAGQRKLANQKTNSKAALDLKKSEVKEQQALSKIQQETDQALLSARQQYVNAAISLTKEGSTANKLLQSGNAIVNTYTAATAALAQYPYPANAVVAGAVVAQGLASVAKINGVSFENGGVFGGFGGATSGGDNTTANVRVGEMQLNAPQQKRLFDIANGRESGGNDVVSALNNMAMQEIIVQVDGREIARTVRDQKREGMNV